MKVKFTSKQGLKTTFNAPSNWVKGDVIAYVVKKQGSNVVFY